MIQKIFATLATSALIVTAAPVHAQTSNGQLHQTYKGQRYFFSDFYDNDDQPRCKTFYPEPIGALPSRLGADDICLPPPIAIIPDYGSHYRHLMQTAISAGTRGDYNTALINFRRARLIEISKTHLGYSNLEALRGIHGSMIAKRYQRNSRPSKKFHHTNTKSQYFWYYWTGTGKHSGWGRDSIFRR